MPPYKNLSFDDNSSNDSLLDRFHKSVKTSAFVSSVSTTTKEIVNSPHKCLSFAYFTIDSKTSKVRFNSLSTIIGKWFTIMNTYFKQIGFGYSFIGFLIAISLFPATILSIIGFIVAFWLITIPQLFFAPITFGISLITLTASLFIYTLVLFAVFVVLVSLWIGLIAALMGIGFVYDDEDEGCGENDMTSLDSNHSATTKYFSNISESDSCSSRSVNECNECRHCEHNPSTTMPPTTIVGSLPTDACQENTI